MKDLIKKCKNGALLVALIGVSSVAVAGTDGSEFQAIWTVITDWAMGTLGKVLALGMLLTSMFMAFVSTNLMGALGALGAALIINYAPEIINEIFTAVI